MRDIDEKELEQYLRPERNLKSPLLSASESLVATKNWLDDHLLKAGESPEESEKIFFELISDISKDEIWKDEIWKEDSSSSYNLSYDLAYELVDGVYGSEISKDNSKTRYELLITAIASCTGYCVLAIKSFKDDELNLAWSYAEDAKYWAGFLWGTDSEKDNNPLSENAKIAANKRHENNREVAAQIKQWFLKEGGQYKSKDKAAEAAQSKFSRSFRTIRKHITGL